MIVEEQNPTYVGDGYDPEPLLKAPEVARLLQVPAKSVYDLPIRRVRLGNRRIRWRPTDVRNFIEGRIEQPA